MNLKNIIKLIQATVKYYNKPHITCVSGYKISHDKIDENYIFLMMKGQKHHGVSFLKEALSCHCVIFIINHSCFDEHKDFIDTCMLDQNGVFLIVEDVLLAKTQLFHLFDAQYVQIRKINVAVTGTNGKTSTTHYLRTLFEKIYPTDISASLGTLGGIYNDQLILDTKLTSPDGEIWLEFMEKMKHQYHHMFFEFSSHALHQNRLGDIKLDGGIWTSLSHDHLDYHQTMEDYIDAKLILFTKHIKVGGYIVIFIDVWLNPKIRSVLEDVVLKKNFRLCVYGPASHPHFDLCHVTYSTFVLDEWWKPQILTLNFKKSIILQDIGEKTLSLIFQSDYQLSNITAAIIMTLFLSDRSHCNAIFNKLDRYNLSVPGRMQMITVQKNNIQVMMCIDFAHTPDALLKTLTALQTLAKGKIYTLFGCGGDRDNTKRPIMGKIAQSLSCGVIVTDDNPRSENPELIRAEIISGMRDINSDLVWNIGDRRVAIQKGVSLLEEGDILLIAGKGHERTQTIKGVSYPFHDETVLLDVVNHQVF